MTTQIVFGCTQCDQTETLTLEAFRLTGYPLCPRNHLKMEAGEIFHLPNDEINQALSEAMRAVARLTVVAIRGVSGTTGANGVSRANQDSPIQSGQK